MPSVRDYLTRFLTVPGVRSVVLVGRDGLPIESAGQGDAVFAETLGALAASVLGTAETLGQETSSGATLDVALRYETASVEVYPLGSYAALATLADLSTQPADIWRVLNAVRDDLLRALDAE